jgi:hypothetical protein
MRIQRNHGLRGLGLSFFGNRGRGWSLELYTPLGAWFVDF